MIPHERSLVKRLESKPFVLLGVNSDRDPDKLKKDLKTNQVTWRSFQNERKDDKAIAQEWQVQGWPTLYLIDHKGTIQKRWLGSPRTEVLDREVDKLVKVAGGG
jgi:protein-disulfide isomerase-like protein with CxxC motif